MNIPVVQYGSSVLRKSCTELTPEYGLTRLAGDLFDTVKQAKGIGLAAPQIGLLKQVFVIDTTPLKDEPGLQLLEQVYVNPCIIWKSKQKVTFQEGCLSIPSIFEEVLRPERIRVLYSRIDGRPVEEELDGLEARIFQHEYDHLRGVLFIDRLNPLKRKIIRAKLKTIGNT